MGKSAAYHGRGIPFRLRRLRFSASCTKPAGKCRRAFFVSAGTHGRGQAVLMRQGTNAAIAFRSFVSEACFTLQSTDVAILRLAVSLRKRRSCVKGRCGCVLSPCSRLASWRLCAKAALARPWMPRRIMKCGVSVGYEPLCGREGSLPMRSAAAHFFGTYRTKCDSAASFSCMYFKGEGSVALSRACAAQEARTWVVLLHRRHEKGRSESRPSIAFCGSRNRCSCTAGLLVPAGCAPYASLRCILM